MPLTLLREIADSPVLPRLYKRKSDVSRLVMYRAFGYISAVIPPIDEGRTMPSVVIAVLPAGYRALGRLCAIDFRKSESGPGAASLLHEAEERKG
ncbi:MAG: hypothetical protein JWQ88_3464 [Rhodoferax sp.]|nr:hypothetical protein [Rhodoferax sp.]